MTYLSKKLDKYVYPEDKPRDYIGASIIGSNCLRQVWYEYKGFKGDAPPNKLKRTWEMGHILERYVLDLLDRAGVKTKELQNQFVCEELPVLKGHCDAVLADGSAIIEIKTAKDASFKTFGKHGLKKWQKRYYGQLQAYMGMSGIKKAYIVVLNKDTSEILDECVEFDSAYYELLKARAKMVSESEIEPIRINNSPMWFECKICRFHSICHKD